MHLLGAWPEHVDRSCLTERGSCVCDYPSWPWASKQVVVLPKAGLTLRYAFVSQRGYYPGSPDKPNQDSLCVHTAFGGEPDQAFFGVFDGHGEFGTQCSQFAKDKVRVGR
jgi:hypothetical protein